MQTETNSTSKQIETLAAECVKMAREQGYDGDAYDLTESDCDWIVEQLGRKPTREEWASAGYGWVGNAHYDARHQTTRPVEGSGWYEHTDGTVGEYVWRDGALYCDRVVGGWAEVPTRQEALDALIAGDEASRRA